MSIKRYILGASLAATLLGGATLALAEDITPKPPRPMVIQINSSENALLRGIVKSVGASSVVVTSWGGDWTVNVSPDTKVMPASDLSQFEVGDFVGAQGSVNKSAAFAIDAKILRDWTIKKEAQANKKDFRETIKETKPRNYAGFASDVNAGAKTLTLTIGDTAYTVNVTATAKIVNRNFLTINFSDIQNGDRVDAYGPVSDTTITAVAVRDISIPR